jgi:uncharacterized protein YuzE
VQIVYDAVTDPLYIEPRAIPASDIVFVSDDVIVDIARDGAPVEIDIQRASRSVNLRVFEVDAVPLEESS